MLKLNLSRAPYWIDLAQGVRVEVEPVSSTLMIGARFEVNADLEQGEAAADPRSRAADSVAYSKAVGRHAIRTWEGVMDEDGKALPVTPEAVDALFEQSVECLSAFNKGYVYKGNAVLEEGNGSSPSPSGASEGATDTAEPASDDATPARRSKTAPKA